MEKRCIIYSITTHFPHKALQDYRRFNVAVTRARCKLFVISSLQSLSEVSWIKDVKQNSYYVEIASNQLEPELNIVRSIHTVACKTMRIRRINKARMVAFIKKARIKRDKK